MKKLILFILTFLSVCVVQTACGGTGAIPSGSNIKMLKDNIRFKTTNTRIMTGDPDDPSAVAKTADEGSIYIQDGTGVMFQKQDSGSSTNWQALLIGAPGLGTDNRVVRWDGTGTPQMQDSLAVLDDLGALSGLTQLDVDNLQLNGNTIASTDANGNIILDPNGVGNVQLPDLTISQPAYIDASGNLVSQDIDLTADVTNVLPIANGGTNSSTALNNDRLLHSSGGAIVERAAMTDGQIVIGSTGLAPVSTTITPTANQVNVANGAGSITLSTPQDIHSGASPTFVGATFSGLAASSVVRTTAGSALTTGAVDLASEVTGILPVANGGTGLDASAVASGQILIGHDVNNNFSLATLTPTANQVNIANADGSITLSTPQDIHSGASPTFVGMTLSGLTINEPVRTDGTGALVSGAIDMASEVTGILPLANGGTNKNWVASNGAILYSDADSLEPSTIGSAGQPLLSGGAGAPTWFGSTGVVKATGGVLSTSNVDLTSEVTGVLPIANGGTNSSTALGNGKLMTSVGGAVVEATDLQYVDATDTLTLTGQANFDNLRLDGNTLSSTDANGDINLDPAGTGMIDFALSGANYVWDQDGTGRLSLQRSDGATNMQFEIFSADSANGDENRFRVFGSGQPGAANAEYVELGLNAATDEYILRTQGTGTALDRAIRLESGDNTDQLHLATDGKIGVGKDSPQTTLEAGGAISQNGVGVRASNLLLDGGFEDGFQGACNHANQTCAAETSTVFVGSGAAKIDASVAAVYDWEYCETNTEWEGKQVEVSCQIKSSNSGVNLCSSDDVISCLVGVDYDGSNEQRLVSSYMVVSSTGKACARITTDAATTDDVFVDDCDIKEYKASVVSPVGNWETVTCTGTWISGNETYYCYQRRVGDSLEVRGRIDLVGAPTAATLRLTVPGSLTIDNDKINISDSDTELGFTQVEDAGVQRYLGRTVITNSTQVQPTVFSDTGTSETFGGIGATTPFTFGNGDQVHFTYKVPIQGWSSTTEALASNQNVMTDWEAFTPSGSWTGAVVYEGKKRRVGDTMYYQVKVQTTGAPTGTSLTINIPDGNIDTTKILAEQTDNMTLGQASLNDAGSRYYGRVIYGTATTVDVTYFNDSGSLEARGTVSNTAPFTFANGDEVFVEFSVPIVGLSSVGSMAANLENYSRKPNTGLGPVDYFVDINCDAGSAISNETFDGTPTIGNISGGSCVLTIPANNFNDISNVVCKGLIETGGVILNIAYTSVTSLTLHGTDHTGADASAFDVRMECTEYRK